MKCANCGSTLSCGCQKRVTPNGKQACSKCLNKTTTQPVEPKK